MINSFINESEKEHYTLNELRKTEKLIEKIIPRIIKIYQDKIKFYNLLLEGSKTIEIVSKLLFS